MFIKSVLQVIPTYYVTCSFYFQIHFVWNWRVYVAPFSGKKVMEHVKSIGVNGDIYVS